MKTLLAIGIALAVLVSPAAAQSTGVCGCPGDVDGNQTTNFDDLLSVLANWGDCEGCPQDIDGDGIVGFTDLVAVLADWGCGVPGPTTTIMGVVTNSVTGDPIASATVTVGPCMLETDETGSYAGDYQPEQYEVIVAAQNFITFEDTVTLFPDFTTMLDVALVPVAPVVVTITVDGDPTPGGSVTATAHVEVLDGSTVEDFAWSQTLGAPVLITEGISDTAMLDLAPAIEYKAELIHFLSEPPIDAEDLPPNVPLPPGEFPGGLQDRYQVVGVNPFSLEEAGLVGIEVEVTTTSGAYYGDEDIETHLPWKPAAGIRNVPIGHTVLLHGKDQLSYDWSIIVPDGSSAGLIDDTTQNPEFTPDEPGLYSVTVTDLESGSSVDLFVFAGTWRGVIVGTDADGLPESEATCLNCHVDGGVSSDQFTPWKQTGHAAIFTDNLNNSSYWGPQCFDCHTVGYDQDVVNAGIDDAPDYDAFLTSGLIGNPSPDNWQMVVDNFPDTAKLANVQCESCHGPQNGEPGNFSLSHAQVLPRVSLSSDVCATCHGEPKRHARFQQWQLSGHANYEVAIDESESGSCSRCHTANGFLAWLPILLGDEPGDPTDSIEVTWTPDEAHPQTCVTCHDPHSSGTTSGNDNDATVRISGNTPELIAGFTAYGVGRGAICMTCHNSRRGLRNDSTFDDVYGTSEASRAPHGSAQADMLMGENAYLVATGNRGNHSFITDTCTNCHMAKTPPPADLSYNQSGTNHTFFAGLGVCVDCHGQAFEPEFIQSGVQENLDLLQVAIEDGIFAHIADLIDQGNTIDLNGDAEITDANDIEEIVFGEFRGRQAITVTMGGMSLGPFRVSDIDVLDGSMTVIGQLYDTADPNLVKAGWNWALVHNDGSLGLHNPSYAYSILGASFEGLGSGFASTFEWPKWMVTGNN